jgi:hypothetical protein
MVRTISFKNGERLPWPVYRDFMLGNIGPSALAAQTRRREPAGALDAALPRRQARDQNVGRLSQPYCDATRKFLGDNGVDPDDVEAVMTILGKYSEEQAEDSENLTMAPRKQIPVGGPRGPVGSAQDRSLAWSDLDVYGQPRNNPVRPLPLSGNDQFSERFPDTSRLKVV